MRLVLVMALAAASFACGTSESTAGSGGSGGQVQDPGGSGGTGMAAGGSGGSGGGGDLRPADRFDSECLDDSVPRSEMQVDPLPVQYRIKPRDGMGISCAGYVLEADLGGAELVVYARTLAGTTWTAEFGSDPRKTTPLPCYESSGGKGCIASIPADDMWRTVKIRLVRDGGCLGTLRQDVRVSSRGAESGIQALDPTDCP
jgi:hypothetical protein